MLNYIYDYCLKVYNIILHTKSLRICYHNKPLKSVLNSKVTITDNKINEKINSVTQDKYFKLNNLYTHISRTRNIVSSSRSVYGVVMMFLLWWDDHSLYILTCILIKVFKSQDGLNIIFIVKGDFRKTNKDIEFF